MNNESFMNELEEPLKSTIEEICSSFLKKYNYKKDIEALSPLSTKEVEEFFEEKNIPIVSDVKAALTTPFAIARYLILLNQQEEMHSRLKKLFEAEFNKDELVWLLKTDLSNIVTFVRNDERKNCLNVRYTLDDNDELHFYLATTQVGWQVSFEQLKAILISNFESYTQAKIKDIQTKSKDDIVISVGNRTIVIKDNK